MNIHSQADCFDLDWTPSVIVLCCKYMSHTLFTLHLLVRSHISLPLPPFSNSSVVDTVLLMRRILLLTHRISWLGSLTTPQGIQLAESWIQFNVFKGSCFVINLSCSLEEWSIPGTISIQLLTCTHTVSGQVVVVNIFQQIPHSLDTHNPCNLIYGNANNRKLINS